MNILVLDIETTAHVATVYKFFKENISDGQVIADGYMMCYAAKWLGEDPIFFDSVNVSSKEDMLLGIHQLLDEADAVVHYNGRRFDIPTINQELAIAGINPPSPFRHIDLFETVKSQFNFPTNRLSYVARRFGLGSKVKHDGHALWQSCIDGDQLAWDKMQEYNIGDVYLTEALYEKILPWIKNHPNRSTFGNDHVCPVCGSKHLQRRGNAMTMALQYQRYQCQDCGAWSRSRKCLPHEKSKLVTSVNCA